jgi:hypothetical protein
MKIMKSVSLLVALIIGITSLLAIPASAQQNDTIRFGGYNLGYDTLHFLPGEFGFVHQWVFTDIPGAEFATISFSQFDPVIPNLSVYRIDSCYMAQMGAFYQFMYGSFYYRAEWTDTPPRDGLNYIFVGGWSYTNNEAPGTTTYMSSNISGSVRIGNTLYTGLIAQAYQVQNSITRLRGDVNDDSIVDTVDARLATDIYGLFGPNAHRFCRGINAGASEAMFGEPNMYDNYLLWAWTAGDPIADGFGFGLPMDVMPSRINRNQPYDPTISGRNLHLTTNATAVLISALDGSWQQTATVINGQIDIELPTPDMTLADIHIEATLIDGMTSNDMQRLQTVYGDVADAGTQPTAAPVEFRLQQNYPNPFNPSTTIAFTLSQAANIQLQVYDLLGRQVATLIDGATTAGLHVVTFDGHDLASGTYLCVLQTPDFRESRRMTLLK